MTSQVERLSEEMQAWLSDTNKERRFNELLSLAMEADLYNEFCEVPKIHLMNIDPDKFIINCLALSKIKQMKRIADGQKKQSFWRRIF